jgi:hypothetical protein
MQRKVTIKLNPPAKDRAGVGRVGATRLEGVARRRRRRWRGPDKAGARITARDDERDATRGKLRKVLVNHLHLGVQARQLRMERKQVFFLV